MIDAQSGNNEEAQLMKNYLKLFFFFLNNSTVGQDVKSQLSLGEHKSLRTHCKSSIQMACLCEITILH